MADLPKRFLTALGEDVVRRIQDYEARLARFHCSWCGMSMIEKDEADVDGYALKYYCAVDDCYQYVCEDCDYKQIGDTLCEAHHDMCRMCFEVRTDPDIFCVECGNRNICESCYPNNRPVIFCCDSFDEPHLTWGQVLNINKAVKRDALTRKEDQYIKPTFAVGPNEQWHYGIETHSVFEDDAPFVNIHRLVELAKAAGVPTPHTDKVLAIVHAQLDAWQKIYESECSLKQNLQ